MAFDQAQARYWRKIQTILMNDWDPIGVSDEPNAANEYDGYISGVYRLLMGHASVEALMQHLDGIASQRMGFTSQPERSRPAAERLLKLLSDPAE